MADDSTPPTTDDTAADSEHLTLTGDPAFTSGDLAKLVRPSNELVTLAQDGSAPLTHDEALKIIRERLSGLGLDDQASSSGAFGRDLAELIAGALPGPLQTARVLASMDLRPYLAATNGKPIGEARRYDGNHLRRYVANTDKYVTAETGRITTALTEQGDKTAATKAKTFVGNAVGITPVPTSTTGKNDGETPPPTFDPNNPISGDPVNGDPTTQIGTNPDGTPIFATTASAGGGQAGFPVADIQGLIDNGTYDLMQAAAREIKEQATNPTGYFPVDAGLMTESDSATGKAIGQRHPQTMSINDSMNYINSLPPSKVEDLQAKLAAGGYFDRLQNGGIYDPGNPFDKNTIAAWDLLLTDSIQQKKPAPLVLGRSMSDYRDRVRTERLGAISKYDPRYTRQIADDYGQSKIGRDLTDAEAGMLDRYLTTLVNQRAGYVAGATDNTADGPLTDQRGFNQDDVELALSGDPHFKDSERGANNNTFAYKLAQLMH
jgi:hypothetical protein